MECYNTPLEGQNFLFLLRHYLIMPWWMTRFGQFLILNVSGWLGYWVLNFLNLTFLFFQYNDDWNTNHSFTSVQSQIYCNLANWRCYYIDLWFDIITCKSGDRECWVFQKGRVSQKGLYYQRFKKRSRNHKSGIAKLFIFKQENMLYWTFLW